MLRSVTLRLAVSVRYFRLDTHIDSARSEGHTIRLYAAFRIAVRLHSSGRSILPHAFGRLFHAFIVDLWARIEQQRLLWIRLNQRSIRAELYQGVVDAVATNDAIPAAQVGRRIVLPASFIGGPRHMQKLYQDAMAAVRKFGKPDLFVTFTCNPNWPDIKNNLCTNETSNDRPDLCARVFHGKLKRLLYELSTVGIFSAAPEQQRGKEPLALIYSIEFQKRGLPHAHILIILQKDDKLRNPDDYDAVISAELPASRYVDDRGLQVDSELYKSVTSHMVHGPCGAMNRNSPCMVDGACSKKYPRDFAATTTDDQDGYPTYRRRQDGRVHTLRSGIQVDNRWIVPYNPYLCAKYDAHINVEACASIKGVKYIYKYVYKGPDRAVVEIQDTADDTKTTKKDEVHQYLDCRYVAAPEACWRIQGFEMHGQTPAVVQLQVHLENQQTVHFDANDSAAEIANRGAPCTTLTAFFEANANNVLGYKGIPARELKYDEFPEYFVWKNHRWKPRERRSVGGDVIGRMNMVHPAEGERFYMRLLLHNVRGARSFDDLYVVDGVRYLTYRAAAQAHGILEHDDHWRRTLSEAADIQCGRQLRHLFAVVLVFGMPDEPEKLFDDFGERLAEDLLYERRKQLPDASYDQTVITAALRDINRILLMHNKQLSDFPQMPVPPPDNVDMASDDDLACTVDTNDLMGRIEMLNAEQRQCFGQVSCAIDSGDAMMFFVDAPGGTGKTHLLNVLLDNARLRGHRALAVASSGVASLILHGGRTAHSRLKIPVVGLCADSVCQVSKQSRLAALLRCVRLIVWD